MKVRATLQVVIVRIPIGRALSSGPARGVCLRLAFDHLGDQSRNFVLQCKDVVDSPVVPLGPWVHAGGSINQLRGDPDAITDLSYMGCLVP